MGTIPRGRSNIDPSLGMGSPVGEGEYVPLMALKGSVGWTSSPFYVIMSGNGHEMWTGKGGVGVMGIMQQGKSPEAFKQIRPHHKSMARCFVAGGLRPGQLAMQFGMSVAHISRILQTPLFKLEVERLTMQCEEVAVDMQDQIRSMQGRALEVLDEDLEWEPTSIQERVLRNKTARDLLDRGGYVKKESPTTVIQVLDQSQTNILKMDPKELRDEVMELTKVGEDE